MNTAQAPIKGGITKHQMPRMAKHSAAAAQPMAKETTLLDSRDKRVRMAARASPETPRNRSATSIMIWVVLPVMMVEGGEALM